MKHEVDTNGVLREVKEHPVIRFRDPNTGQETLAEIIDKDPTSDGPHVEGRRIVEVSIEAFGELMSLIGYFPVDPATGAIVIPDQLLGENEQYADEVLPDEGEDA